MAEISDVAVLDASNTARWSEGLLIPQINDSARALEGLLARWYRDTSAITASQGTASAYQVLTNRTFPAYAAGMVLMFRANVACNAGPTLQVNALTAKPLKRQGGAALVAGEIKVNQIVLAVYNTASDAFECIGLGEPHTVSGTTTFAASTFAAVTLSAAQPDANYKVFFDAPNNATYWTTDKTTTGFTINCSSSHSLLVGWELRR